MKKDGEAKKSAFTTLVVLLMFVALIVVAVAVWTYILWLAITCLALAGLFILSIVFQVGRMIGQDETMDFIFDQALSAKDTDNKKQSEAFVKFFESLDFSFCK